MHPESAIFSHSGDLGDTIYFMPVMRALGGGVLNITKLPADSPVRTRQDLTGGQWLALKSLLERQDYVHEVVCKDLRPDFNGDLFRGVFLRAMKERYMQARGINLVTWQCIPHQVNPICQEKAWLDAGKTEMAKYVFNRTQRYINPMFPWKSIYDIFGKEAVFLGSKDEYQSFINDVGPLPYVETPDLLSAAEIINGAECFFGNQSCLYAIAEGLKKPALVEVWLHNPNTIFKRSGAAYGYDYQTTMNAVKKIQEGQLK